MQISILPIGSELLDGRVTDTNSKFIGESISLLGGAVSLILTVTDSESDILDAISYAEKKSDVVVLTGGLGPTTDDLTREMVSSHLKVNLIEDPKTIEKIKAKFKARGREYDPSNAKQALYPEGGSLIQNNNGTAPGFWIEKNNKLYIALPGVPSELYPMWNETVVPLLRKKFSNTKLLYSEGFKTINLPESVVGSKVSSLAIPSSIIVSYRANFPEIEVKFKGDSEAEIKEVCLKAIKQVGEEFVFTQNLNESFPEVVSKKLFNSNVRISTAESCTGGLIAKLLTDLPGSSKFYLGGVNAYSNDVKISQLGVSKSVLDNHGAVSSEVASLMADGARKSFKSDIAVSVTGIAGPDGGTTEKPVGLFYIGISTANKTESFKHFYPGTRKQVRTIAAYLALEALLRDI